jgi:hypothetical protein
MQGLRLIECLSLSMIYSLTLSCPCLALHLQCSKRYGTIELLVASGISLLISMYLPTLARVQLFQCCISIIGKTQ